MSILIKNMEMPTEGEYDMTLYVCSDGIAYMDVIPFPVDKDRFEVVPVPPHGRCVDADKMQESIRKQAGILKLMGGKLSDVADIVKKGFLQEIANAPTIIPAEEEEL